MMMHACMLIDEACLAIRSAVKAAVVVKLSPRGGGTKRSAGRRGEGGARGLVPRKYSAWGHCRVAKVRAGMT